MGRNGDPNFSCSTIQNSYYLNTKTSVASYNYSNGVYNTNTEGAKTQTQMKEKSFISTLGDAYTEDTQNDNDGYPILKWQLKENK